MSGAWESFGEAFLRFLFLNWAAAATLLLLGGLAAARLPRLSGAARHGALATALGLAALLPIGLLLPGRRVVLRRPTQGAAIQVFPAPAPAAHQAPPGGPTPGPPLGWLLLAAWASGALARGGALAWGVRAVRRATRRAWPVDGDVVYAACGTAVADLRVLESPEVGVPSVVGARRPVILLPMGFAGRAAPGVLRNVLLHEAAHCRRHDPAFLLGAALAHAVLFWHPLAGLVRRAMEAAAEDACDAAVLARGVPATGYARTLVTVLEGSATPQRGLTSPLGGTRHQDRWALRRRVARILGGPGRPSRAAAVGALLIVLGAAGLAGTTQVGSRPAWSWPPAPRGATPVAWRLAPPAPAAPPRVGPAAPRPGLPEGRAVAMSSEGRAGDWVLDAAAAGGAPSETRAGAPAETRCVVFVLDVSGSMRPHQEEARRQLLALVRGLAEGDTFNVLAFAAETTAFAGDPVAPVESSFQGVQAWLAGLPEQSGTRLMPAVRRALATPGVTSVVVISDGEPWQAPGGRAALTALFGPENPGTAVLRELVIGSEASPAPLLLPGPAPARPQGQLEVEQPRPEAAQ